jgi:hypothetical protein
MSKVSNYFSLQGAARLTMANMQLNIEEGRYDCAMQEHFNLLFLTDLIQETFGGLNEVEREQAESLEILRGEAAGLAFSCWLNEFFANERFQLPARTADAKRRKTRRTTTRQR